MLLLTLLLLCSCTSGPTAVSPQATVTPVRGLAATSTASASTTGPTPVPSLLDSAPTDCPLLMPPQASDVLGTTLVGGGPAWIRRAYYAPTLHLNQQGYTPWPGTKIIWEIGPNYPQAVTVHVSNLQTGTLAWWGQESNRPPEAGQVLRLDPNHPSGSGPESDHGILPGGWHEWGTYLYLLASGCYTLQVSWPGGQWHAVFAAGR